MAVPDAETLCQLGNMAHKLRLHSIESTNASASGHPTSCSSIAEIMSVLFFHVMKYDVQNPKNPANDRLVLSKGHAAPILYAAWAEAGLFPVEKLLNLRKIDNDLEGHPTPRLNFVDVATGSLGQGLSLACGMAYVGKHFDASDYRVYCVIGDGESAEGSVWEALNFASFYKLSNLCAIFDVNRLGQSRPTSLQHDVETYRLRVTSFGFHAICVDGHDVAELCKAFAEAATVCDRPTAIVAKTFKGKYFVDIENKDGWHGKAIGDKSKATVDYIRSLMKPSTAKLAARKPTACVPAVRINDIRLSPPPDYKVKQPVPTRLAYGTALAKLVAANDRVVALDGDTKNSTYSDRIVKSHPRNHIECFIAEQNLAGVAIGCACRDRTVTFASTFATFLTRAFDQIRMGAISATNANFVGSHCGVSIGEDGPSQMGLEDVALFRAVAGSTVFYPSDAVATERAVELAANTKGICFIRTTRGATPVIYCNDAKFAVGKACIVRKSSDDRVLVIAAGVTLFEAIEAYNILKEKHRIMIRIIDPFTVKPIDRELIVAEANSAGKRIITVEDHYYEGGLGEAVLAAVSQELIRVKLMAVGSVPRSGKPKELIEKFAISAKAIVENVLKFVD